MKWDFLPASHGDTGSDRLELDLVDVDLVKKWLEISGQFDTSSQSRFVLLNGGGGQIQGSWKIRMQYRVLINSQSVLE